MAAKKYTSKKKINWSKVFIIGLLGLALLAFILQSIPRGNSGQRTGGAAEPTFRDMGDLTITDGTTGEELAAIDIELATTPDQVSKGLMWRRSMDEDKGMLFVMDSLVPQSFWMLNTYIPLDIIYLDENKRVVSIAENTTPKSTDPIPSGAPALYVLEVNAGYAARKGIKVGDRMEWYIPPRG